MTRWSPTDYNPDDFANRRHIGPSPAEMAEMLKAVGADSLDALIEQTVPAAIRQSEPLDWPALSEAALLARMEEVAKKNRVMTSLIGQGYYGTVTPPAIQRNILENPAWYTAYTPYQPEIAQGRLEALRQNPCVRYRVRALREEPVRVPGIRNRRIPQDD